MKITYTDKEITFTFPRFAKRMNPYGTDEENENGYFGEYPTLTGLIVRHQKDGNDWEEMGWANTIDMDYKGKPDQFGDFVVKWDGIETEFREWCRKLDVDVQEMTI